MAQRVDQRVPTSVNLDCYNKALKCRMKKKGIPIERVEEHYRSARESLKRGSRSDMMKVDRFYNKLFKENINADNTQGTKGS